MVFMLMVYCPSESPCSKGSESNWEHTEDSTSISLNNLDKHRDLGSYAVEYHLSPEHKKKQRKGEQKLHFKQIARKNVRNNLFIKKTTDPHLAKLYNFVFRPLVLPGYQLRRLGKPQTAAFFQCETAFYNPAKRKPNMHWILKHSGIWPKTLF